jgi:hypothetical protein
MELPEAFAGNGKTDVLGIGHDLHSCRCAGSIRSRMCVEQCVSKGKRNISIPIPKNPWHMYPFQLLRLRVLREIRHRMCK